MDTRERRAESQYQLILTRTTRNTTLSVLMGIRREKKHRVRELNRTRREREQSESVTRSAVPFAPLVSLVLNLMLVW